MNNVFSDTTFDQLPIHETVLQGIRDAGFSSCTPVQERVLPRTLAGENIAAQSQTGTGKTATFLITMMDRLLKAPAATGTDKGRPPLRGLVLAPTRELVVQITAEAELLGRHTGLSFQAVFGGIDYDKQRTALQEQNIDILVATPGRLIDYLKQRVVNLNDVEMVVIDEADRMFDLGFINDIRWILRRCSPYDRRQSLLFSATLSTRVMELAYEHLNITESTTITPGRLTADKVKQRLYHVGSDEKLPLLFGLLARENPERALIFCNTKRMAETLERYLKANEYPGAALTGDVPQHRRLSILKHFKERKLRILVATDVASRGLHIDNVTHVFNFDLPQDPEDYVHRIGRTARVGATGHAISLASEDDAFYLEPIEKLAGGIPVVWAEEDDLAAVTRPPRAAPRPRKPGHGSETTAGRGRKSDGGRRPSRSRRPGAEQPAAGNEGRPSSRRPRRHRSESTSRPSPPSGISD
ncbi:MAG: DEAD/DEAH box helicase [Deltaproteobacteria bacterium]|nr:DEAD/DEAH box helicase [Candidatus Anaeroferrophillacea bacterium]